MQQIWVSSNKEITLTTYFTDSARGATAFTFIYHYIHLIASAFRLFLKDVTYLKAKH